VFRSQAAPRPGHAFGLPPRCHYFDFAGVVPMDAAMLGRKRSYDRARLLAEAARAQRGGRLRKAVARYQEILGVEPENADVHRRIAPLLARTGQGEAALTSYRRAASELEERGFVERAIGVYREAAQQLPRDARVWWALAELELKRDRRPDAVAALLDGRRRLRTRAERPAAIRLLERACQLEPARFDAGFELTGLLAKAGQRDRALALLEGLAQGRRGPALRRVRARQLNLAPGPGTAWRFFRSLAA
jgi:tetratricopeptide (TPR) repeat protein